MAERCRDAGTPLPNIKSGEERLRVGEQNSGMHWKVRLIEKELMKRMFEDE